MNDSRDRFIFFLRGRGYTLKQIAERFGISSKCVRQICVRQARFERFGFKLTELHLADVEIALCRWSRHPIIVTLRTDPKPARPQ